MMLKEGKLQHGCICDAGDRQTKPTRTDTINYVYDGMLAVQMRSSTTSSYTRGLDLSLSLQGAGGIGGLLAQTASGAHSYYHSDGNGNITYLMKADQSLGASYRYDDAYGNVVTTGGTLSNPFRFSSKEWIPRISAYYYGYRFYYPSIQRWLNRDPIEEKGGINLYGFVKNDPITQVDPLGLDWLECVGNCIEQERFDLGAVVASASSTLGLGTMPKTPKELKLKAFGPRHKLSKYTGQPSRWASRTGYKCLRRFGESKAGIAIGAAATGAIVFEGFYDWGTIIGCAAACGQDNNSY